MNSLNSTELKDVPLSDTIMSSRPMNGKDSPQDPGNRLGCHDRHWNNFHPLGVGIQEDKEVLPLEWFCEIDVQPEHRVWIDFLYYCSGGIRLGFLVNVHWWTHSSMIASIPGHQTQLMASAFMHTNAAVSFMKNVHDLILELGGNYHSVSPEKTALWAESSCWQEGSYYQQATTPHPVENIVEDLVLGQMCSNIRG